MSATYRAKGPHGEGVARREWQRKELESKDDETSSRAWVAESIATGEIEMPSGPNLKRLEMVNRDTDWLRLSNQD